jgi:hypothetical protein
MKIAKTIAAFNHKIIATYQKSIAPLHKGLWQLIKGIMVPIIVYKTLSFSFSEIMDLLIKWLFSG